MTSARSICSLNASRCLTGTAPIMFSLTHGSVRLTIWTASPASTTTPILVLITRSPHRRLSRLYTKNAEQALFGVIRTNALRRTHGIQRTVSDGHLLLTELILQGPFAPAPSQSLLLRFHPRQHGGDRAREMRWLGARRSDRLFAYTRTTGRLSAAVLRSPLHTSEKIACLGVVGRDWTLRTWRSSASDVKHLLSDLRPTEADRTSH